MGKNQSLLVTYIITALLALIVNGAIIGVVIWAIIKIVKHLTA